jgi:hypothetical protein
MQEFLIAVITALLIQPLQDGIATKLEAARAPQAVVAELASCAQTAAPQLIDRATSDPVWATVSAVRLAVGWVRPEALLVEAAPGCGPAAAAAQPFLSEASEA